MAEKKLVEAITSMDEDFAQWYTDVVKKAELIEYTSVKGCMAIKPYGYAIWELIQKQLDERFKETGVENVYMPNVHSGKPSSEGKGSCGGLCPEVAWVTHGGLAPLQERLCVRPTSETLFCDFYKNDIHSYRDLPKVYNQWCSVVRWEKETRPFLRSREFLWQEGHTAHATMEEAEERTIQMLNLYADFCEEVLAMPVIRGKKTDKEKFAGAEATYTIEALMHDGKALQSGTSHNFGDGFAKAFGIQFTDKDNKLKYVYQTSWGMTTRLIGAIIMVHGDNSGLVLPPRVAPVQIMIIPIQQKKEGVLEMAYALRDRLSGFRVKVDDTDKSPGWKFSEQEMRGIPIRVEIGPKDIEAGRCVICRRDTREKIEVRLEELEEKGGRDPGTDAEGYAGARPRPQRRPHQRGDEYGGAGGYPQQQTRLCEGHVVRRSGLRGSDQGKIRGNQPLHAFQAGAPFRHLRLLRKTCEENGLLGQSILNMEAA